MKFEHYSNFVINLTLVSMVLCNVQCSNELDFESIGSLHQVLEFSSVEFKLPFEKLYSIVPDIYKAHKVSTNISLFCTFDDYEEKERRDKMYTLINTPEMDIIRDLIEKVNFFLRSLNLKLINLREEDFSSEIDSMVSDVRGPNENPLGDSPPTATTEPKLEPNHTKTKTLRFFSS